MSEREKLSAVVIARDEAHAIGPCLESLAFADEILLIDSGSSDDTVALAEGLGAQVIHQEWLGYGAQKQFGVEKAQHDWVLSIDADERVTPELRENIRAALRLPTTVAFEMPRCNRFMGRWLRHGEGYPDWSRRLFDRRLARWSDDPVHEKVLVDGSVGSLSGDLRHESEEGLADYLEKQNRYTTLQALELHRGGRRAGLHKLLLSPLLRFIKFYFLRRGFLDGLPGLVHIVIGCSNSFFKYAKMAEISRRDASGSQAKE